MKSPDTETETVQEVACRGCNELCALDQLDGAFECPRCAAGESDPDAEHREAYYLDIAGGSFEIRLRGY